MSRSRHALKRMQQRSVSRNAIDIIMDFGHSARSHRAERLYFTKTSRRRLNSALGDDAKHYDRFLNMYLVLGDDGSVITVGHRTRRFRRQ